MRSLHELRAIKHCSRLSVPSSQDSSLMDERRTWLLLAAPSTIHIKSSAVVAASSRRGHTRGTAASLSDSGTTTLPVRPVLAASNKSSLPLPISAPPPLLHPHGPSRLRVGRARPDTRLPSLDERPCPPLGGDVQFQRKPPIHSPRHQPADGMPLFPQQPAGGGGSLAKLESRRSRYRV
ncbi:uncharacterized protein B0I36DRAFT_313524 [Microdochium trichocladiopsis]|uniref:Uncharacterized protein n=1 Tax=Microdochium trichocladiopsis TaxID=1682393 RepID=A0A9P8YFS1_9PEZI|nr:uncharacterized protein B0I36DRAFT_313524 [Microdochium trichocladiopsis]KAH7037200.1 hypothetical protein B0I36DRAFT_313524 [Microdochium trichocladiopsis]